MYEIGNKTVSAREHQETTEKILSYVQHTGYFQHLRNHYHSFRQLGKAEVRSLLKSGEVLRVSEEKSMMISFNQLTVCVVSYGDIFVQGKRYTIGKFFIIGTVKVDICFKEKSMIVMFNKDSVEAEMRKFEDNYFRRKLIEKLLPTDQMKLTKHQLTTISDNCLFKNSFYGEEVVGLERSEKGVILLLDGNFSILTKSKLKIGSINFDYFGEEILWEDDFQYCLTAESVECRYVFLPRDILIAMLTQPNLKVLKCAYGKRLHVRKELECSLNENISFTKDFVSKMKHKNMPTIINPQYKEPIAKVIRKTVKQLRFHNTHLSHKVSTASHVTNDRKLTTMTDFSSPRDFSKSLFYEESMPPKEVKPQNFEPKMYKDQRAKSQFIFKRRVKSVSAEKGNEPAKVVKQDQVTDKDMQSLKNLPKTLSVLLKYYESTERLRPRPKTVNAGSRGGFVSCSKERRLMTTMKLHKQIFMRQYFEIKTMEDKAFKTWR